MPGRSPQRQRTIPLARRCLTGRLPRRAALGYAALMLHKRVVLMALTALFAACDGAGGPSQTASPHMSGGDGAPFAGVGGIGAAGGAGAGAVGASGGRTSDPTQIDAGGGTGGALASDAEVPLDGGRDASDADASAALEAVWSPLTVMAIVNPLDHGAVGDGVADDQPALEQTIAALPDAGGIIYLPDGTTFRKTDLLAFTKHHVKWWAPNRQATIRQEVLGVRRRQALLCRNTVGCGFFGLKLVSDASARFDALEDNQIAVDHGSLVEVVGCEIEGSAATGIFLYGSTEHYLEGNYIHHTWADHIHHTAGARASWVWGNYVLNESPSRGDDGVACVTYGAGSARCGDMEWWDNTILRSGWGRGYAVIGGDDILIHHNWAIGVAGAGIIVASEGSFMTSTSRGIQVQDNVVYQCGHSIGHPGILISGLNPAAGPLADITLQGNVAVDNQGGAYRAEGERTNVTSEGLKTDAADLPSAVPTQADIRMADTSVLRTRDTSHVAERFRPGLYRIHVRRDPSSPTAFQQRFEYVVKGQATALRAFTAARASAGGYAAWEGEASGTSFALVLEREPIEIPSDLSTVTMRELRVGDRDGTLSELWRTLDSGAYAAP
jgi:hypothetical protein